MPHAWPRAVRDAVDAAGRLGRTQPAVVAVGLAGSWARGTARPGSDIDLVVLTSDPEVLLARSDWFAVFDPAASLTRCGDFGAILERRLALPDGTEVEVGIGTPSWACTRPVDPSTRDVVSNGFVIVHDPSGMLGRTARPRGLASATPAGG